MIDSESKRLTMADLKYKNKLYNNNIEKWEFYRAAYNGGEEFLDMILYQHARETDEAFLQRKQEAFAFNYPSSIIHLLNFFLTDTPPLREPRRLGDRNDYKRFLKDADLYGTDFDVFINEAQKLSAIFGTVGILIDKQGGQHIADDQNVYPYLSCYTPENIYDWGFERDLSTNTYKLSYVKLKDDMNTYLVWTKTYWQKYICDQYNEEILDMVEGINPIGEVPFVFMPNIRSIEYPYLGISDLKDVANISGVVARVLSECSEIIKYSAFPMLKMPDEIDETSLLNGGSVPESDNVVVGSTAVLGFNPEYGVGGQPSWLSSPLLDPVKGIREYVDYVTEEMFRGCLLSNILVHREKSQQKSGALLRVEQKQLSSLLSKKANNMVEAEISIMKIWCKWQSCEDLFDEYEISKTRAFSVDEMAVEIEYSLNTIAQMPSDSFARAMFKKIANVLLPNVPIVTLKKIEDEIDQYSKSEEIEKKTDKITDELTEKKVEIADNTEV